MVGVQKCPAKDGDDLWFESDPRPAVESRGLAVARMRNCEDTWRGRLAHAASDRTWARRPRHSRIMRISVLIPCRNAERYIRATLESILAQRSVDLEIIVIDDGSTDRSNQIIRAVNDP